MRVGAFHEALSETLSGSPHRASIRGPAPPPEVRGIVRGSPSSRSPCRSSAPSRWLDSTTGTDSILDGLPNVATVLAHSYAVLTAHAAGVGRVPGLTVRQPHG